MWLCGVMWWSTCAPVEIFAGGELKKASTMEKKVAKRPPIKRIKFDISVRSKYIAFIVKSCQS